MKIMKSVLALLMLLTLLLAVGNISELALAVERGAIPEVRECIPVHNDYALPT